MTAMTSERGERVHVIVPGVGYTKFIGCVSGGELCNVVLVRGTSLSFWIPLSDVPHSVSLRLLTTKTLRIFAASFAGRRALFCTWINSLSHSLTLKHTIAISISFFRRHVRSLFQNTCTACRSEANASRSKHVHTQRAKEREREIVMYFAFALWQDEEAVGGGERGWGWKRELHWAAKRAVTIHRDLCVAGGCCSLYDTFTPDSSSFPGNRLSRNGRLWMFYVLVSRERKRDREGLRKC